MSVYPPFFCFFVFCFRCCAESVGVLYVSCGCVRNNFVLFGSVWGRRHKGHLLTKHGPSSFAKQADARALVVPSCHQPTPSMTDLHLSCFLSTDRPKIQDLAVTV